MRTSPRLLLGSFFGLASVEAAACLVSMGITQGSAAMTISRLAGMSLIGVTLLACGGFTWLASTRRGWAEGVLGRILLPDKRLNRRTWAVGAICVITWVAAFLPAYKFGGYELYFARIQPWLVWLALFSLQTLLLLLFCRSDITWDDWQNLIRTPQARSALSAALLVMAGCLAFWLVVRVWRVGITRDVFWDKTGVPLLNFQIMAAGAVSLLAAVIGARGLLLSKWKFLQGKRLDGIIFGVIWAAAAIAWIATPQTFSHFAPGPYPPNNAFYPYSDALNYDLDAQFPLIGVDRGSNGNSIDKPLYTTFLFYLHALAGQDFATVVNLQVAALAVFPALIYCLGKLLHSRAAGIFAAVLAIFKTGNAIRGSLIIWTVSTPKMLMSEFPTAVGFVLLCLFVFLWLRGKEKKWVYAMAAGGVLGLMTMIRNNPWFLMPVILLLAGIAYGRQWKRWLGASGLFLLVLVVAIAPWEVRNVQVRGTPFYILSTLQKTIWNNRYLPVIPTLPAPGLQPLEPETAEPGLPVKDSGTSSASDSGSFSRYSAVFFFVANNFSHNLIASALTLPTSLTANDLDHVINGQGPASLWAYDWDGSLPAEAGFLLVAEIMVIALGIGFCWSRWKIAGLVPLILGLAYMLALGLARTSGGRYIVPVDWLTYFYSGLGLVQLVRCFAGFVQRKADSSAPTFQPEREFEKGTGNWRSGLVVVGIFLIIGGSIPVSRTLFHNPYPTGTKISFLDRMLAEGLLDQSGFLPQDLKEFARGPNSFIAYGRSLYPRFLEYETDGNAKEIYNDLPQTQPHLVFEMITPNTWFTIDLPQEKPPAVFPNGSDVIVLGCKIKNNLNPRSAGYIDSRVVVVLSSSPNTYLPSPAKPLSCP